MFIKSIPLYIRFYTDEISVHRLDTEQIIKRKAKERFSNNRIVLADIEKAENLLREILKELIPRKWIFSPSLKILIQQIDNLEGGLTNIERKALYDIASFVGGKKIMVIEHNNNLTSSQALFELKKD